MRPVGFELLDAGYTLHPEHTVLRTGRLKNLFFPSMFGLIHHPTEGVILYDTGYSMALLRAFRRLPGRLYALVTPVTLAEEDTAVAKLGVRGIDPDDVRHIFISHFHSDHVAGLGDFPKATLWFHAEAWEAVRRLGPWRGLLHAHVPELIPPDLKDRARPISSADRIPLPTDCSPFRTAADPFADQSLLLVDLPGHAAGQLGMILQTDQGRRFLLAADAAWHSRSIREQILPHPITRLLFDSWRDYATSLEQLRRFWLANPDAIIAPSHCDEIYALFCNQGPC